MKAILVDKSNLESCRAAIDQLTELVIELQDEVVTLRSDRDEWRRLAEASAELRAKDIQAKDSAELELLKIRNELSLIIRSIDEHQKKVGR